MPGSYAHYRFGLAALGQLDPEQHRSVQRFRQLFDMGLHGPDLFYYSDILGVASNGKAGKRFHAMTGAEFFAHAIRGLKLKPSEGATAYLCGLVAHYALDSITHPFIEKNVKKGLTALEIMAEFDRYLLVLDGKNPAHLYDGSRHIHLTDGECQSVAALYHGVSAAQVSQCVKGMARCTKSLVMPKGSARDAKLGILRLVAPETAQRAVGIHPNRECVGLDPSLLRLYELAAGRYSSMMEQLQDHLRKNTPLGPDFNPIFGE